MKSVKVWFHLEFNNLELLVTFIERNELLFILFGNIVNFVALKILKFVS